MNDPIRTISDIAASLGIDATEVEQRLRFLDFTPRDEECLRTLHAETERRGDCSFFVDAFYQHLLAFAPTHTLIREDATLARLKRAQGAYFERLTAGHYDYAYMLDRLRIGLVHERVGLTPQWYIGAYNKYITLLAPRIREYFHDDPERMLETLVALFKIVFYDMGLAIDAYIHAAHEKIQTKAAQLKALNEVALAIASSLSLEQVIEQVLRQGMRLAGVRAACVTLYDNVLGRFSTWHTEGLSEAFVKDMRFRPGGLAEEAFVSGASILSSDRPGSAHPLSALAHNEGIRAILCLPLVSHTRRIGLLYLYRHDQDDFQPDETELLSTLSHIAAGALENAQLHEHTLSLAATDALTGLHNRRALNERLDEEIQRTRRFGQSFSLLLLDIDFFKKINDTYGHSFGDSVLQALARLLRMQMREVDFAARYGGEEFVMLLPATDAPGARLVAERVRETIAENAFILPDGASVSVTVSIGVATFPEGADSAALLIACADHALYTAKHSGRNRVCLYRDTLKAEIDGNPRRVADLLNQNPEHLSAIVAAVDMKAPFLHDHTTCTERLAVEFGKALGLSAGERESLALAARVHDIGMVTVPDAVLNNPDSLSDHEWGLIREHPVTGAGILVQVPALAHLAPVVRSHHERYDGSGYPDGLQSEAIPHLARALALVDTYCALTAQRPRRRALSQQEARAVIVAGRGLQFDPALTDAFVRLLEARGADQTDI